MIILICVGSSCHLKGSPDIVNLLRDAIAKNGLEEDITLAGSFCMGKCEHSGVTVSVDDDIVTGVTKENFNEFFSERVLKKITKEKC